MRQTFNRLGRFLVELRLTPAGLPIVLVLSWAYDITSEGIRPAEAAPQPDAAGRAFELARRGRFAAAAALIGMIALATTEAASFPAAN